MPKTPLIQAFAAAILFGSATPASKFLLDFFGAHQLAGLLYLGAAVGVSPFLFRDGQFSMPWKHGRKTGLLLLGAIFFGGVTGPVFLLFGLKITAAASVSLWLNMELAATALLGALIFKDHLTGLGWVALVLMSAAAVLLSVGEGQAGWKGGLLVAAACLCWGLDNHFTALIDGITAAQTVFWKGLAAGTVNLAIGMAADGRPPAFAPACLALGIGLFSHGLSLVLYILSAQRAGAVRSQIVFSSSPFFGVLLSVLFLGEAISGAQAASASMIVFALALLFLERHEHPHRHPAEIHTHWHRHDDARHGHEPEKSKKSRFHSHEHEHGEIRHAHPHWPDREHRHDHCKKEIKT